MKHPLTLSQLAIYYESINKAGLPVYIIPVMIRLNPNINLDKLCEAVEKVVAKYPVLSMVLEKDDDGMPCLTDDHEQPQHTCRVETMTTEEFASLTAHLPEPFNLDGGHLFEVRIFNTPEASYMYLPFHHIIGDGSTYIIVLKDIVAAYKGENLQDAPLSIFDIQAREEENAKSPRHNEAKEWYAEVFEGIELDSMFLPDKLRVTTNRADDNTMAANGKEPTGSTRKVVVLQTDYDRLFRLSRRLKVPMSMVLDGAFGYLAGVWNGTDHSSFCTIFAGRSSDEEKKVVGMMVKTIPIYCSWNADTTVAGYLAGVAEYYKKAKGYADAYSFAEFCADTGFAPKLNFSYRGSVQAENTVIPDFCTGSRRLGDYTTGDGLLFIVDHLDGSLVVRAEYQGSAYTEQFIESVIDAYDMVLNGFLEEEKLCNVQLCSSSMVARMDAFHQAAEEVSSDETIVDVFQRNVALRPNKIAAITYDAELSYRQVDDIAARIASFVSSHGLGAGDAVAIMVGRNKWMLPATLGVLSAGVAYQPLDPSYPGERLNFMMRDADVRLLIMDRDIELALDDDLRCKITILYTDEISRLADVGRLTLRPAAADPFILLYTSGTTGQPKGVRLTHSNLMALARGHRDSSMESASEESVWAMYASYGFDAGFFCLLLPMIYGGTVAVVPEEIRLDMESLNQFFISHNVTFAFMTTQVGRIFATTIEDTSVKTLMVGGEKLVPCVPPVNYKLYNLYGPTEGTVYSHIKLIDCLYSRAPIGRTLNTYRNYIVDKYGRRMPLGALGEMLIAGPQVGAGYLNLPEKTAAVFCSNPFDDDSRFALCYHTGDIVRLLPASGEADIIGRNDGQVKIRGFRIELTEVEQMVREYPDIKDATVQAFDSPMGGKFIAAYVVSDVTVDARGLKDFIASHKPSYMVPEVVMQIDSIPLNRNQKVDRRALPVPVPADEPTEEENRKPNILEKTICEIVGDVLRQENLQMSVPLSRLGLTSISSIRLASALYKRFGIGFKGADLVKDATILSIEDEILRHLLDADVSTVAVEPEKVVTSCPLTVSQQGVYADTMRQLDSTAYNIPVYFRFAADTDPHGLADMVSNIVNAHPYLRDAHLQMGEVDVEQTVMPHFAVTIAVKQMSAAEFDVYKTGFIKPFDLMQAPLCRFEVVATPDAVYLLIDVHHIVFDGSSLTVLLSQLKTLADGGSIRQERFSYLDYAAMENQWLNGEGGAKAAEYFKTMLADCEAASEIPSDQPQGQDWGERGIVSCAVDFKKIEAFCRSHALTPAALFMAATCYATARFTSSRSAYISTISTGRADVRFNDTFGMFVKTLPVAMTIGDGTSLEYAHSANTRLSEVVENEMYPYARICADYNYAPNIVYEYQYGLVDELTIGGQKVERHLFDIDTLKFKIAVHVEEIDGKPSVAVHYRKGLYTDAYIRTFCDSIATVAERIISSPDAKISALSMLTASQRDVLSKYSASEVIQHSDRCFHHLMECQAALHPDRKAVVAQDRTLTYAELNRLANVVANNLISKGIKRGDKVVILLSRTSRFFTSLYGILKAGAAYIPSSPDYPEERKRSVIEDSAAAYVVTDDNVEALHQGDNDNNPDVAVTPDDLVYLIYTSGSTGKPKGVLLRHRGIVNYVTPDSSMLHTHAIVDKCSVVGSVTTVAFDMALKEWGIALSNGLTLVFADDEQTGDPMALSELFVSNGVDYFNTTPSRMQQYMELDAFCKMLSGCKVVICGAEKYPENLLQRIRTVAPDAEIFNTYGPTEITVSCNAACLTRKNSVTVGRPLRNYIEHIVDTDDNLLPPGVIGELLVSGDNIAMGYNASPEQTAKVFVQFDGLPTYRSSDYARWDSEGNVVILGRKDTQVKLRGLRIELGEIERVLSDIEGVAMSHIMIRNVAGRENLVAYYVLKPDVSLTLQDIRGRMAEKLTDYMVPSLFVALSRMPLTPNGKINARELPEPAIAERESGKAAVSELQQFFVNVFKEVLGIGTVYADDNFFALGGTSLTATRIMIAASKAGHRIVYADIFANPTPIGLAALLEGSVAVADSASDAAHYDYRNIDGLLAKNTLHTFLNGAKRPVGTVLLTGATGYAGMHVLHELLTAYDVDVVCLGRDSRKGVPAEERIAQLYFYYFGEHIDTLYHDRVKVVKGDITKIDTDFNPGAKIDTVINCAANVKHFSAGTDIEDINYYGVLRLIDWCRTHGAVLVQTSTISITGRQSDDRNEVLTEQSLYIGQDFGDNKYITSKFMAERAVLEAHAKGEIIGKIVRLGNLAPRERDGEFQINFTTNGFMNRLKSVTIVGCYPYSMYGENKDISPIDDVAKAIVLFAQTPDDCVVFHGNNSNRYSLGNFYYEASKAGLDIHACEADTFREALNRAKSDSRNLGALVGLMAYEGMGAGLKPVGYSNDYSNQVLLRMGFHWPVVSSEYVNSLVRQLDGLGFFSCLI